MYHMDVLTWAVQGCHKGLPCGTLMEWIVAPLRHPRDNIHVRRSRLYLADIRQVDSEIYGKKSETVDKQANPPFSKRT